MISIAIGLKRNPFRMGFLGREESSPCFTLNEEGVLYYTTDGWREQVEVEREISPEQAMDFIYRIYHIMDIFTNSYQHVCVMDEKYNSINFYQDKRLVMQMNVLSKDEFFLNTFYDFLKDVGVAADIKDFMFVEKDPDNADKTGYYPIIEPVKPRIKRSWVEKLKDPEDPNMQ